MAPLQQQLGASSCSPAGKPAASGPRAQPSTIQRCAMPRCTVQCQETLCNGMLHCAMPRSVVQHHAVLCSARKCRTMPCCAMPHCTVQWHTMPCSAVGGGHKPLHCSLGTFPFMLTSHRPQTPTCFSTRSRSCSALAPAVLTGAPGHLALPIGRK